MPIETPIWSQVTPDGDRVRIVARELPPIADEEAYAITLSEGTLIDLLAQLRADHLGFRSERTGGL